MMLYQPSMVAAGKYVVYTVVLTQLMDSSTFDYVLSIRHFDFQIWQIFLTACCLLKYNLDSVNTAPPQANHRVTAV